MTTLVFHGTNLLGQVTIPMSPDKGQCDFVVHI